MRTFQLKAEGGRDRVGAHIEVLQLCFGRGLIHKLQDGAQITDVDASLVQGLRQGGSVHGQSTVIQTVLHLRNTSTRSEHEEKFQGFQFFFFFLIVEKNSKTGRSEWLKLTSEGIWQDTRNAAASFRSCFCFCTSSVLSSGKRTPGSKNTHKETAQRRLYPSLSRSVSTKSDPRARRVGFHLASPGLSPPPVPSPPRRQNNGLILTCSLWVYPFIFSSSPSSPPFTLKTKESLNFYRPASSAVAVWRLISLFLFFGW